MEYKVLIVEDEPRLRAVLCDWFRDKGDDPIPAPTAREPWKSWKKGSTTPCCWTS